ncbi:hypothetical protein CAEBREN_03768 [Caenorhabditis brenneri]|uniref:Uncharacterized protein n=1 Tax=Caenorhabditis brenneri TaxID=135651 RepID=G0P775_CAEBE|nr:hypothetical protein CAEBREN_03768 [Caenorhabditis brenneri]
MPSFIRIIVLNIVAIILAYYYYDIKMSDLMQFTGAQRHLLIAVGVYLVFILIVLVLFFNHHTHEQLIQRARVERQARELLPPPRRHRRNNRRFDHYWMNEE